MVITSLESFLCQGASCDRSAAVGNVLNAAYDPLELGQSGNKLLVDSLMFDWPPVEAITAKLGDPH